MNFVTTADLESGVTEALVGFEQHGFGVAVLRVRCKLVIGKPVYFPPCTGDPGLARVRFSVTTTRDPTGRIILTICRANDKRGSAALALPRSFLR